MKHKYFFLLFFLTLIFPGTGHTQGKAAAIDSLLIELWPDYDRASVLVLLTGTLPADTKLPAAVTLPFSETAQLNAVARIDNSDGKMKDDIFSSLAPGEITFITPDLRFRLEYYLPYAANNNQRTFDFTWLADLSVNGLTLKVQQPTSANSLAIEPSTANVSRDEDGFAYYTFPVQAVPAGQSSSVHVEYTMTMPQLSAQSLAPQGTSGQETGLPSTSKTDTGINWPTIAVVGGIIIVIIFVWQISTRRTASNGPITRPTKSRKLSHSKFCHNCGNQIGKDDRFCSKCGTDLQGDG
jgi:hypothetical protein